MSHRTNLFQFLQKNKNKQTFWKSSNFQELNEKLKNETRNQKR